MGRLAVSGPEKATVPHLSLDTGLADLRQRPIQAERSVVFSENEKTETYYVNGKVFDPERIDVRVPLGNVEEWTIRNDSDDFHVFHIHQVHFQVVEINGVPQNFIGYQDSVQVPERGFIKIILPFTDPRIVGRFMFHCHVLEHEDKGMMAHIEVYDPLALNRADQNICRALP